MEIKEVEIRGIIIKGMCEGYQQNLKLLSSQNDFHDNIQEYLLTVNVAQMILQWNKNHEYNIRIEYPLRHFYNNAFPSNKPIGDDIFSMDYMYRLLSHSPTWRHNSKIDLVITEGRISTNPVYDESVLVGIEIKGVNKRESEIKKDLNRLSKALLLKDPISDNSIQFCFCSFLLRLDKDDELIEADEVDLKINIASAYWEEICASYGSKFSKLTYAMETYKVQEVTGEDVKNLFNEYEDDISDVASATGVVRGVMITIKRK